MPAVIYFLHWCIVFTILIFWYDLKPINIDIGVHFLVVPWWRNQMETFFALLALCAGNSPITGEFTAQRPVTRSFDVFFDLCLNKRLSKQSWGWWFETLLRPLWRHCNARLLSLMARSWTCHLSLPDYMVPRSMDSSWISLFELRLTAHGIIDIKRTPILKPLKQHFIII